MKYRCEKCNAAHESKAGAPARCTCGGKVLIRAERNLSISAEQQVFRSDGQHWVLDKAGKKFIPYN